MSQKKFLTFILILSVSSKREMNIIMKTAILAQVERLVPRFETGRHRTDHAVLLDKMMIVLHTGMPWRSLNMCGGGPDFRFVHRNIGLPICVVPCIPETLKHTITLTMYFETHRKREKRSCICSRANTVWTLH